MSNETENYKISRRGLPVQPVLRALPRVQSSHQRLQKRLLDRLRFCQVILTNITASGAVGRLAKSALWGFPPCAS